MWTAAVGIFLVMGGFCAGVLFGIALMGFAFRAIVTKNAHVTVNNVKYLILPESMLQKEVNRRMRAFITIERLKDHAQRKG